jgi:hypothetical protein
VAHAHDLGDGLHRQAVAVGLADGLVALGSQSLQRLCQRILALGIDLGEGGKTGAGLGSLAFRTGDLGIVEAIPANRLA